MNIRKRQIWCDKKKWFLSEKVNKDMSGDMDYCNYCKEQTQKKTCMLNADFRIKEYTCGKAYNKMTKREKKKC